MDDVEAIRRAQRLLPYVVMPLARTRANDGVEVMASAIGTRYRLYPVTKVVTMARGDYVTPVDRLCIWTCRDDDPDAVGGWIPLELFDGGEVNFDA